ncbi:MULTISPECIES: HAD-IA family hydrolase [Acidipropionibacterium]|uniref:HAD-IA family hydrolase n=1 Tax=Acidipropionibacterium TaxID=1912215 RepID=UPI00068613E6|nr:MULTISPECIES: HAD-IA family hydrolase [Acidipropionibacterium]
MNLGSLATQRFDAVILDLDNTLVDSQQALLTAFGTWAREYAIPADQLIGRTGWRTRDIVDATIDEPRRAAATARIDELELTTTDGITAVPGAADALTALHEVAAVATSSRRPVALARLTEAGLEPPRVLVSGEDVERGKPEPDAFLLAARRLDADPARCLVVEDAPAGVEAARRAGMSALALTTSTPAAELPADAVVADLSQVTFRVGQAGAGLLPAPGRDVARFLRKDGRISQMPTRKAPRLTVLGFAADHLPVGIRLTEPEVNALLRPLDDDVALLRRHLVDEGLVGRPQPGVYLRPRS